MTNCQFYNKICENDDELHIHTAGLCPVINGDDSGIESKDFSNMSLAKQGSNKNENVINVNYVLNKKNALMKKANGCERMLYKVENHPNSCVITFSTACFEVFKSESLMVLKRNKLYTVEYYPTDDNENNRTQDTLKVKNKSNSKTIFTINR